MPSSAVDSESIIQELRTKKQTEILEEVLTEIEHDDNVASERPELSDDINQKTYNIPSNEEVALDYEIEEGTYSVVFLRIANLLNNGLSPNIGIFGKSQRGKSTTALYILHVLHHELNLLRGDFDPRNQVIYEVAPYLLFYRYNARVGALFEEAGETINKNDYNSKMNKAVRGILNTQGKKQIPNIFVTPEASRLDPDVRSEIDIEIEMVSTGKAKVTLYERKHGLKDANSSQNYRFARINGTWNVPQPPQHIKDVYETIDSNYKGRYIDNLLKEVINEKIEEEQEKSVMEF